jgi:hypothetical protein
MIRQSKCDFVAFTHSSKHEQAATTFVCVIVTAIDAVKCRKIVMNNETKINWKYYYVFPLTHQPPENASSLLRTQTNVVDKYLIKMELFDNKNIIFIHFHSINKNSYAACMRWGRKYFFYFLNFLHSDCFISDNSSGKHIRNCEYLFFDVH